MATFGARLWVVGVYPIKGSRSGIQTGLRKSECASLRFVELGMGEFSPGQTVVGNNFV